MELSVSKLTEGLLSGLDSRQREVLEGRYGTKDGNSKTLAEIGDSRGITRERVRQIETAAMAALRSVPKSGLKDFSELVKSHLKNTGGLRRDALLLADLKLMINDPNTQNFSNKVHFLLELAGEPKLVSEDNNYHSYWYLNEDDRKRANAFVVRLAKLMEASKSEVVTHGAVDALLKEAIAPHNLKDLVAMNYISTSKKFHVNEYGDFGLADWPEVNPKTMRDWAHIILRKNKKPAHFEAIAGMINKARKNAKKPAHAQTVHNELIKDPRFVLVGRGTYGLQEFGIMPGTAREVAARILEKHGPLSPAELLKLVLKERVFKRNTILINLQNKKYFKRLEDGRYTTLV